MSRFTDDTTTILVKTLRLLPFGILVSLDDGGLGIIREREIAWDHWGWQNWRKQFTVGETLRVVVLGEGHDQRLELSLRLAENDPWINLDTRYPLGKIVVGTITGVQHYGVFVEIEPGITGLLHATRLPSWAQNKAIKDLFWPGDMIKVAIERIDPKNRHVGLSLGRALNQRWDGARVPVSGAPHLQDEASVAADLAQSQDEPMLPPWNILVVEDDLAQRGAMTRWMQQAGLQPCAVSSAEEALEQIERKLPELVLTDFGLPGMSGIAALQQIRRRWPALRCALMTDWARVNEHTNASDALCADGIQLLIKPLRPADIVSLLTERFDVADSSDVVRPDAVLPITQAPALLRAPQPQQRQLAECLARLCATTTAEKAVIFMLDAAQREVRIVAEAGLAVLNEAAIIDLIHSPVRDVAEDRQLFRVEDAQQTEARVRYLKPLLAFRSGLGLPLPTQLPEHYALFLFSSRRRAFSELHEEHATATALATGVLLEREQFQQHIQEMQLLALLGQLSRALVHELNHQLSPINFVLDNAVRQFGIIEHGLMRSPQTAEPDIREMHEIFRDLVKSVHSLTETARTFGRITMQTKEQAVDLGDVIMESVQLLRDMADRAHVRLAIDIPEHLPLARLHAVQFQQILLNITINAIQQIELVRPTGGGRVLISVAQHTSDQRHVFQLRIEDDGPGIHRQLWQRIFDLGFTTRTEGGSGLGLYITRSLVEALNGRAAIEQSYILWGTTLIIELPITG
jgi:signal transduction histidine kinase/predicted RNA-binding protein with RPS1 domain